MQLIAFSKLFKDKSIDELAEMAHEYGLEGYDLCLRSGYPVNPDNAREELPRAAARMREAGLEIPMITAEGDLLEPSHPTAEPILGAMDEADVRLIKLGYFRLDPAEQDYWQEVDRIRAIFEGWEELGRKHQVKICYHTHSNRCMGLNCASMMHLIRGCDPQHIGAYIDTGHMAVEGEEWAFGLAMVRDYLSMVALKDAIAVREEKNGHGTPKRIFPPAGEGIVDWTVVFAELARIGFDGPLSAHCEFQVPAEKFTETVKREIEFFRAHLEKAS
jgi:L-ribulose-5-phosphate 3-epimerase